LSYKRRIYLINPKFQIKFALLVTAFLIGVSLIYPYTIYQIIESVAPALGDKAKEFSQRKSDIFLTLGIWQVCYSLIIFSACIFFSHKIAGPIYKLNTFLKKIPELGVLQTMYFRDGDYFRELEESYNAAIKSIQDSRKLDFEQLEEIRLYLKNLALIVPEDKKIVLTEINKKIEEISNRYQIESS
tara:strand:+ start:4432 stop:4989 length:558 start_codon:yes stop_codon:yes gene_type:complete